MNKLYGLLALGLLLFGCASNYSMSIPPNHGCQENTTYGIRNGYWGCVPNSELEASSDILKQDAFNLATCVNSSKEKVDDLLEKYEDRIIHTNEEGCKEVVAESPLVKAMLYEEFDELLGANNNTIYSCEDTRVNLLMGIEGVYYSLAPYQRLCQISSGRCEIIYDSKIVCCLSDGYEQTECADINLEPEISEAVPSINMSIDAAWIGVQYNRDNFTGENITYIPVSGEWDCDDDEAFTSMDGKPKCIRCEGGNLEVLHYDYGVTYNCNGELYISGVLDGSNSYSEVWSD